ncbi:MAG: 6-carboxytetrahydropterin synthase [Caldilineaceae bacterium]|nr:6-carboxytetrahydropterin synthase [Caldilineaceae bacterium]
MYTLAVQRNFTGQHFLIGGDWGAENQWHSHHYRLEIQLEGATLDQHGYLVDIVQVEALLEEIVARYRDKTLNDLAEFAGLNPSIEHFCRIVCAHFSNHLNAPNISAVRVKIWENEIAWASYSLTR